jgi:hypothetical protein
MATQHNREDLRAEAHFAKSEIDSVLLVAVAKPEARIKEASTDSTNSKKYKQITA